MATKAQRAAADKYDAANMAYQTVKVRRQLLDDFKSSCAARGDRVNTVLREAMENYVNTTPTVTATPTVATAAVDDANDDSTSTDGDSCEQR